MKNPKKKEKKPASRFRRVMRRIALGMAVLVVGLIIWGYFALDVGNWENFDVTKINNLQQTSLIYDSAGDLITTVSGGENRTVVSLERVPVHVRNAFLAAEDLRFYKHPGIDIIRIGGALLNDIRTRSYREGASTITQQLIKLSHLTEEKTWTRKIQEAYLALKLEREYTKDEILGMYLNFIYFGNGAYGIQAAAEAYFGVGVEDLTLLQGASLAAAIKGTAIYSPHINPEANQKRREYILDVMETEAMITPEQHQQALAESLYVRSKAQKELPYGWFVDTALAQTESLLSMSSEEVLGGGLRIFTTLDRGLQDAADKLYTQSKYFPPNAKDGVQPQSAMSVVDVQTSAVRALVGGRSYTVRRGLNRATDMRRQPGSSIKPLAVYGPALEMGYSTASVLLDEYGDFNGYKPKNAGNLYYGRVTMRTALASSLNVPAVRLLQEIGVGNARQFLTRAGVPLHDNDRNLSLALGSLTTGVTPTELAASYAVFSNGGMYRSPYVIERIVDSAGKTVYQHEDNGNRAMSAQNAYLMTSLLQSVTSTGTGSKLSATGLAVAGKTGTVSLTGGGNRDVWMAAYTPELALTVWMGYDKTDSTHKITEGMTGGGLPAGLATAYLQSVYKGKAKTSFKQPDGLVWLELDKLSIKDRGEPMLASDLTPKKYRFSEIFLKNNRPYQVSNVWQAPRAAGNFYITHAADGMPVLNFTPVDSAQFRIQRDSAGESLIIAEVTGQSGVSVAYTDQTARQGVVYTYRLIPVHAELLAEGILLEGPQAVQVAQAQWGAQQGIIGNILDFFAPASNTVEADQNNMFGP